MLRLTHDEKALLIAGAAILGIAAVVFVAWLVSTAGGEKAAKHIKSGLIGLDRTVTLYDCDGEVIESWHGKFKVETEGGGVSFIDDSGREIKVSGTVVVREVTQ